MRRPPCCDKLNVKRGPWTPEEDAKMLAYVSTHGIGNWTAVPKKAGLNRCGKSCRLRWTNYLRPDLKHDSFTSQEEDLIINLHQAVGSRWSLIAKWLPGRTDNDVKNHWNTKLRKKLHKMGIDPVTHKPFSQIFTDYGNISTSSANPITGSFNNLTLTNSNFNLIPKPEPPCSSVLTGPSMSNFTYNSNPWDNFVPQIGVIQPHLFSEAVTVSSCCSSSSSTALSQLNSPKSSSETPVIAGFDPACLWNEFLVSDPVFEQQKQEQDELSEAVGSYDYETSDGNKAGSMIDQSSSSSAASFVDVILDKDRQMGSQFAPLLDPSFDY